MKKNGLGFFAPTASTDVTYMGAGRDEYDRATTEKQRNRIRLNDALKQLKQIYPGKGESALLATPEGRAIRDQIEKPIETPARRESPFADDL